MMIDGVVDPLIDPATFRHVLGHYPTGVCVVTATGDDGDPIGMAVGSFTSVSLDPPLVGFLPDRSSTTWPRIARAGGFCVNILSVDQTDLCQRFAMRGGDKFAGLDHARSAQGWPRLPACVAWIDCTLHQVCDAGDHLFVMGRVIDLQLGAARPPLIFLNGGYGRP